MAARISALILVTGLFVAAWSGDHSPVAVADMAPVPAKPTPYTDEPVRETALRRWKVGSTALPDAQAIEVADASEAVQLAQTADDISMHIDWLEIEALLHELDRAQQSDQAKLLLDRVTTSVAKIMETQQRMATPPIAAEAGAAVRQ